LPASGPLVKPHTKGAVFRNSTIEMRSFFKSVARATRFRKVLFRMANINGQHPERDHTDDNEYAA
jgi:hypothetical protein